MRSGLKWTELSALCHISSRTLRDWVRARYTANLMVSQFLSKKFLVNLPTKSEILEPYWYIRKIARRGALARQKIYGLLGNRETRRKGGIVSQQMRRKYPEKYRRLGCIVRKKIKPLRPSIHLAELIGILLGDGGLTDTQARITLNRTTDHQYANFVSQLMKRILGEKPSVTRRQNVINLTLSGVSYVESLERLGLRRGNKVKNQVVIPSWIVKNRNYSTACLRGLIDTDGGVYFHHHITHGIPYVHLGLTFTNHSRPLIVGAENILKSHGFSPSVTQHKRLYIYNLGEVKRYFLVVKSHNPKHQKRLKKYLKLYKK